VIDPKRIFRPLPVLAALALMGAGAIVYGQIEGSDRGVAPIDSSGGYEVGGIQVDVYGKSAELARMGGWREAQRQGWRLLWAKMHGGGAPGLSDGQLDGIVSAIVVDKEEIGPNRYVATLGVVFDRARTGEILGVAGNYSRSAPLLVIPIQWVGGTAQSYEGRTEWQKAWARFRNTDSPIDYVRVSGTGADPMLLNAAQTARPGRRWWRVLLDQYGAADVLIPQVRLERLYPGGPVIGHFTARYGPDNKLLQAFDLRVENSEGLPKMMDQAVIRMDSIYASALAAGQLRPDTSLIVEAPPTPEEIAAVEAPETTSDTPEAADQVPTDTAAPVAKVSTFTVQFETPDVQSVGSGESAVRSIPGVKSSETTSLALGGYSVMQVQFEGDVEMLRIALSARGYKVQGGGSALRISR
jgi:hypothetical protein